ncbi:MAG: hypothetical protein ACYS0K_18970 [Planctomycetota bacterium]|jgi:hypothetical protein
MTERRRRILSALADYGARRGQGPLAGRKAEVLAILKETDEGKGIEPSPAQWRDRTTAMLEAAITQGAHEQQARELCSNFLTVLDRRFEAFEAALWRWAYDESRWHPPLYLPPVVVDDFMGLCERLLALTREAS